MNRTLLTVACATAFSLSLSACSSGGSDDPAPTAGTPNNNAGTPPANSGTPATPAETGNTPVVTTPPPSGPPTTGGSGRPDGSTKAGTYIGSFGFGDGIYVIDDENDLAGLALMEDGSAQSLFGNVGGGDSYSGTLRFQTHDPSSPPTSGVFGAGRGIIESTGEYDLTFVPGQTIEGGNVASLTYAAPGQIAPATAESVAGSWRGENQFTDCETAPGGCRLVFDLTFEGTTVTGSTSVEDAAGTQTRLNPISGVVSEYGDVLLVSFDWNNGDAVNRYDGTAFFATDGTDRLIFLGETLAMPTGNPTLGSLLTRAQ